MPPPSNGSILRKGDSRVFFYLYAKLWMQRLSLVNDYSYQLMDALLVGIGVCVCVKKQGQGGWHCTGVGVQKLMVDAFKNKDIFQHELGSYFMQVIFLSARTAPVQNLCAIMCKYHTSVSSDDSCLVAAGSFRHMTVGAKKDSWAINLPFWERNNPKLFPSCFPRMVSLASEETLSGNKSRRRQNGTSPTLTSCLKNWKNDKL